ncbi:MAG: flagellar protein FlaG, partial [Nitrococcus sp.]|nr:flagellar protein FlaG [Nitrococcus sp.]
MEDPVGSITPLQPARHPARQPARNPAAGRVERDTAKEGEARLVSGDGLQRAVRKISESLGTAPQRLEYAMDEITGQTVIRVLDAKTGALIRQLPPEEIL